MRGTHGDRRGSGLARWLLAFRLARREFRRHPWRHALVVLMIMVPVLAAMVAFSAIPTSERIYETRDRHEHYDADLHIFDGGSADESTVEAALSRLPAARSTEVLWTSTDWLVTGRERADGQGPELVGAKVIQAPTVGGATRFRVDEGRLPRDGTEIFLAGGLAEMGSWQVGDRIRSGREDREFVVSGVGVARHDLDGDMAVVTDVPESYWTSTVPGIDWVSLGTRADAERDHGYSVPIQSRREIFIWLPAGSDPFEVAADLHQDRRFASVIGATPVDDRLVPAMALVFAALSAIVAIVSSAAFAIASRRQLRSVGLLATAGADPATIRAALVLQGAFPGAVAGALALTLGLIGMQIMHSRGVVEEMTGVEGASPVVAVGGVGLALVLGVLAGTGAAWLPARSASRVPVLSALAGRRPVGPVPNRVPFTGLFFVGAGAIGLAFLVRQSAHASSRGDGIGLRPILMIATILAILFGLISLAPTLVAVMGTLSSRVTGTTRIALRGLARHRGQSAAAVAAVAICLAVPVGVLTTKAAAEHEDRLRDDANEIANAENQTMDTAPAQEEPAATSARSSPSATTIRVHGELGSHLLDDLVTEVEAVIGPVATVPFVAFNDGAGGWYTIAAISTEAADENLAPWAAEQLRGGGAVALLGQAGPVVLDDDVTSITLDSIGTPDGAPGRIVSGLDADYLVPDSVLQTVAIGRPPLNLALMSPQQLSADDASRLEAITSSWQSENDPFRWPTLDQLRAARQTTDPGGPGADPLTQDAPIFAAADLWLSIDWESVSGVADGRASEETFEPYDEDRAFRRWLTVVAVVTGALSLLVLTITLSLRAVDSVDDHRAAVAAGAAPARIRRQHALEGAVLASLGAILALPLGWLPVTATIFGQVRQQIVPGRESSFDAVVDRLHLPGWEIVPILVLPIVAVWVLWMVGPWLRSTIRRGPVDQVLPRH